MRAAWLAPRLVIGVAVIGGVCLLVTNWRFSDSSHATRPESAGIHLPSERFDAPAYSPQASTEDFKQEALRIGEQLLQEYPRRPDALAVSGRLRYSLGQTHEAQALWQASCEIDPQFANAYAALGTIAKDRGDFSQAVEMFQKVSVLAPTDHHTPPLLAEALIALGRTEEAIVVLDRHVHTQPVSAPAVVNLGLAYLELKEYDKARQTLEAVTKSYPDDPRGYYALAQLHNRMGEKQKARESMQQFRERSAVDEEASVRERRTHQDLTWMRSLLVKTLWEAGQVYRRMGSSSRAEESWQKAAYLDPAHVLSRRELLTLYEQNGQIPRALAIASELSRLEPDNPDHWYNLALLQARLDRFDDALETIWQALRLDPDNSRYRQVYELCKRGGQG